MTTVQTCNVDSHQDLSILLDTLVSHLASRRDALNAIAQLGNRFEDWVKWEAIIALHNSLLVTPKPWYSCAGVEHSEFEADLFVGFNPWSFRTSDDEYDWPMPHERDVWIELKARTTRDKAGSDLAADLRKDLEKLQNNAQRARSIAAVLLLQCPGHQKVQATATDLEARLGTASFSRTIYDHSLNAASHELDKVLIVTPQPLALFSAWYS